MPADAEFCTECGAPLVDAPGVGGSDAEVYPELAKANLHRMRKEFKPAEDICLSILRRFPNNFSANALLGDISAEKGDLEQAAEWYELAIDLADSPECKAKLEQIRAELARRQAQTTVETLGIPPRRAPIALYAMIFVIVATFAVAAILLANRKPTNTPDVNKPIVVQSDAKDEPPTKVEPSGEYRIDDELASQIAKEAGFEGRSVTVSVSDGEPSVRILLHAVGEGGEWGARARFVMAAYKLKPDAPKVDIEYWKGGASRPETDIVERSTWAQTQAADFDQTDEALLVETLFGHKLEPTPDEPKGESTENKTVTPPLGEGSSEATDPPKGESSGG